MTATPDLDAATDRLVDSLTSARDVARSAIRDDIAPAIAAAVDAARDASGPVYAEATSRAGDAVSALRGSDAAKALGNTRAGKAIADKTGHRRRRWPKVAAVIGLAAAAATVISRRIASRPTLIDVTESRPATANDEAADLSTTDSGPESS
jgi:hypothetical protein